MRRGCTAPRLFNDESKKNGLSGAEIYSEDLKRDVASNLGNLTVFQSASYS